MGQSHQVLPSQELAVDFFREVLDNSYAVGWYFLRGLCANEEVLQPPRFACLELEPAVGSPYRATDPDYDKNIKLIFGLDSEEATC